MKIIIIGNGKVGSRLASQLAAEGHDIVVLDKNPKALQSIADNEDVMCIAGNAADYQIQREAGMSSADLVIACTASDEANMLSCLMATKHGVRNAIARVRDPEYYDQIQYIQKELGIRWAINPELDAARFISRILLFPAAISIEPFASGRVQLVELPINSGNPLIGKNLIQVNQQCRVKVLICAVKRGEEVLIPKGSDVLQEGDRIFIVSDQDQIQSFFKEIDAYRSTVRSLVIVGGSRITYYLVKDLLNQDEDIRVKIIEQDTDKCRDLAEKLPEVQVVHGDGTNTELMGEIAAAEADAFVAVTGMDEVNIMLSMYANRSGVSKVITKVNQIGFTEMLEELDLDSVVSPKMLTANRILRYVRAMNASSNINQVETLCRFIEDKLEALEFYIEKPCDLLGIPLKDLTIRKDFLVACIVRRDKVIIPGGFDTLELGDTVVIVTTSSHVHSLEEMIGKL